MYNLGSRARNIYVGPGFMPNEYDPSTVLIRGPNDNVSILSGYSYLMGMYPNGVEGVDLMQQYSDLSKIPITEAELNQVRSDIGGVAPKCGTQRVDFYPGNNDKEFIIKPKQLYPGQKEKINDQLNQGRREFENKYGSQLYDSLAKKMGRRQSDFNFATTLRYLDDYMAADENSISSSYNLDRQTDDLVTEYYNYYFGRGLFRDEALTRVFTDSYFTNLIQELAMKRNSVEGEYYDGKLIETLKHSIHIGNHQTYAAILHALGNRDHYRLDFSKPITWELFKRKGNYYVKALNNGNPLELEGNANDNGEVELSTLFEYFCSKLYYGDDVLTAKGIEDPDDYNDKTIHCLGEKVFEDTLHREALLKNLNEFDKTFKPCDDNQQSKYYENTYKTNPAVSGSGYHADGSWSSSSTQNSGYQSGGTQNDVTYNSLDSYSSSSANSQTQNFASSQNSYIEPAKSNSENEKYTEEFNGNQQLTGQSYNSQQGYIAPVTYEYAQPQQQQQQQLTERIVIETVTESASVLKGLVDSSPTYDYNERENMHAPRGSETYVAPLQSYNYDPTVQREYQAQNIGNQYIQNIIPVQGYQQTAQNTRVVPQQNYGVGTAAVLPYAHAGYQANTVNSGSYARSIPTSGSYSQNGGTKISSTIPQSTSNVKYIQANQATSPPIQYSTNQKPQTTQAVSVQTTTQKPVLKASTTQATTVNSNVIAKPQTKCK